MVSSSLLLLLGLVPIPFRRGAASEYTGTEIGGGGGMGVDDVFELKGEDVILNTKGGGAFPFLFRVVTVGEEVKQHHEP